MINIEDIKVGKTYLLPFEVIKINDTDIHMRNGGVKGIFQPEELTENSHESAPKYDPSRKFRKGDIVRPRERDGREPWGRTISSVRRLNTSCTMVVYEDEARGLIKCKNEDGLIFDISPFFLELMTPIEAMEPYYVQEGERSTGWGVWKRNKANSTCSLMASYSSAHPKSKAAAEAECARLNEEYRKEHI